MEYRSFVRAFESLIESRTFNNTDRLYYLEQFTAGDVKELVISCHHLPSDVGYDEARRLLEKKFGDEYRIASAYETKALNWPNIKAEDGVALNRFSVFLTGCKNALAAVVTCRSLINQGTSKNWCLNSRTTSERDGVELQTTSWSYKPGLWSLAILSRSWIVKLGLSTTLFLEKFLKAQSHHLAQGRL